MTVESFNNMDNHDKSNTKIGDRARLVKVRILRQEAERGGENDALEEAKSENCQVSRGKAYGNGIHGSGEDYGFLLYLACKPKFEGQRKQGEADVKCQAECKLLPLLR